MVQPQDQTCDILFCYPMLLFTLLFANFWSHFAYVLGQFPNCFRLMSGWKIEVYTNIWENEAYTCAGRVSLLSETTLDVSEREFGGRTRRRNDGSPMLLFEQILLRLGKVTKTWIEWVVFVSFQAKRTDGSNEAGIIPSQICEERLVKGDTPAQCIFIRWLDPVICRHTVNPLFSPPPGGAYLL